jgi:hypothetical protein
VHVRRRDPHLPPRHGDPAAAPPASASSERDGQGQVVGEAVARAGAGAGAAAERRRWRRPRALLQARQVPRPGGLLGQGTPAALATISALAAADALGSRLFPGPAAGRGALDPPGGGALLRPALGSRPPRRRRLDRAVSPNLSLIFSCSRVAL